MKKSKSIMLATLITVSMSLVGCFDEDSASTLAEKASPLEFKCPEEGNDTCEHYKVTGIKKNNTLRLESYSSKSTYLSNEGTITFDNENAPNISNKIANKEIYVYEDAMGLTFITLDELNSVD